MTPPATRAHDQGDRLVTIGEFARLSRLTSKALRLYDKLGLLHPARVDDSNGYRYYAIDQLETARVIGLLRGADMSLERIDHLLSAAEADPADALDLLDQFQKDLDAAHRGRHVLVRHVHTILQPEGKTVPMFPIQTRTIPPQRVMSMQRRLHVSALDAFLTHAKSAFAAHLGDAPPTGPFTVVFHGIVDDERDGPVEAILGCPAQVQPTELIGIRTEPAHDQAFTSVTKEQWSFPAILAAYDAVACSPEVLARPGSSLSCREVYLAEPNDVASDELVCEIAFPLA